MSITRLNEFEAAEGKEDALYAFLQSILPHIAGSEGCVSCELLRHQDNPTKFVILERWVSVAAHQQSLANFPKEDMQAIMPLLGAPPKGAYYHS